MKAKFQTFDRLKNEFPELFRLLDKLFPEAKKVAIGLSGGSDSMFLAAMFVSFWQEKTRDLDQLFFLHCNHQMRKESKEEADFLVHFFQNYHLKLFTRPSEQPASEEELRTWRYACFQKYCQEKGIQTIALGHHLNDRIETSMMNLLRGCGIQGLMNMQVEDQHHLLEGIQLIRPLLTLTKTKIERACQSFKIPFVQDQSNFDSSTSLRNQLRNEILLPLSQLSHQTASGEKSFFESWKLIYAELEKQRNADESSRLVPLRKNPYRNAQFAYEWTIPEAKRANF